MAKLRKPMPKDDLGEVLQSFSGRRFLTRLFDECGVFADPYVRGDTHATARETGRKSWAIGLFNEVMSEHSDLFLLLLRERTNKVDDDKVIDNDKESE